MLTFVLVRVSKLVTMPERRFRVMIQAGESSCGGMQYYEHVGTVLQNSGFGL